jgi:hypothetical protein
MARDGSGAVDDRAGEIALQEIDTEPHGFRRPVFPRDAESAVGS